MHEGIFAEASYAAVWHMIQARKQNKPESAFIFTNAAKGALKNATEQYRKLINQG